MTAILAWIVKNPLTTALIAAILFLSASLGISRVQLDHTRSEVDRTQAALTAEKAKVLVCEANTTQLQSAIEAQNKAVETLSADKGRVASAKAEKAATAISKPLPVASGPGAKAMNEWLVTVR